MALSHVVGTALIDHTEFAECNRQTKRFHDLPAKDPEHRKLEDSLFKRELPSMVSGFARLLSDA